MKPLETTLTGLQEPEPWGAGAAEVDASPIIADEAPDFSSYYKVHFGRHAHLLIKGSKGKLSKEIVRNTYLSLFPRFSPTDLYFHRQD